MRHTTAVLIIFLSSFWAHAQTDAFTYQGKLNDGATPATGTYYMQFALYDTTGWQIDDVRELVVNVVNGIFTVQLDFGPNAFSNGQGRELEIAVRRNQVEPFTTLTPRQPLTSSPYSIKARMSDSAAVSSNSERLGGVEANQYVLTSDARMSDARVPLAGSGDYIQNGTTEQATSNFNISGEGRANIFSAGLQFNIGASRVLSIAGIENLFVGTDSGTANVGGGANAFVGFGAGRFNTTGNDNSFFGNRAGRDNSTGSSNSFFGAGAGRSTISGSNNVFVGLLAGNANSVGGNNTILGANADLGANNLTNATAIGFSARVTTSNSLVLGNNVNVGIGTSAPNARLQVSGGDVLLDNNRGLYFRNTLGATKRVVAVDINDILRIGSGGAPGLDEIRFDLSTPGTVMTLDSTGNVGIGTTNPGSKLTVGGLIETTTGGIKFPDGTVQTTASTGGGGILNQTVLQTGANFNVDGTGRANVFNAATQFNLNGSRILSNAGSSNLFVGVDAGTVNTGSANTFVGAAAGQDNTTGSENSFFGRGAGTNNTEGFRNTFAGRSAGLTNTTGFLNSFFGAAAGFSNTVGNSNSFFGVDAGRLNIDGNNNSFFGTGAGNANTSGSNNSFFGRSAGFANTTGANNAFFGFNSGRANTEGSTNSFFGVSAGFANTTGASNTLVGFNAGVANSEGGGNTFVGKSAGQENVVGNSNAFFGANAGRDNLGSDNTFVGNGAGMQNTTGEDNTYLGRGAGNRSTTGKDNVYVGYISANNSTTGSFNTFVGRATGVLNTSGSSNTFLGIEAGFNNETGNNNTILGKSADVADGSLNFATAIGANSVVSTSNTIALGRSDGSDKVVVYGLGAGGSTQLCRNAANQISTCSSSRRYKNNISEFRPGLSIVNRLRPVTFNWNGTNQADMGLVAEEVAEADENLVVRNSEGQVEGVKYDRVGVVLVNAVKEQQAQIEAQQKQIDEQRKQIEMLKKLLCAQNASAAVCVEN